ncbi:hypothetical protein Vretimale_9396 [Volvox reticuliferus]|uniref:2Fe-2S ferredoxin-type domain-containing protein n=1 Tax=Volvox reticuliferus TaxID=1737510 RepID=A0A8J4LQB1_9CHLO|nr:hypothetical protein Vretifemale_9881 [Volvox reticuliferus]GIM04896.1 hypothetical protein Vretimale_9396 [Volvox reticuliferus]
MLTTKLSAHPVPFAAWPLGVRARGRPVVRPCAASTPTIQLNIQTKEGPTVSVAVESGDILRTVLMAEKIDLYTTWGKIWQCGGGGNCGTCIVDVREGADLLSERTQAEKKKLAGKPATWRLACQTRVGDGENTGAVAIATKPQQ